MGGNLTRLPGEKFADFAKRQRAAQEAAKLEHDLAVKNAKWLRRGKRALEREVSDFDYSMNS